MKHLPACLALLALSACAPETPEELAIQLCRAEVQRFLPAPLSTKWVGGERFTDEPGVCATMAGFMVTLDEHNHEGGRVVIQPREPGLRGDRCLAGEADSQERTGAFVRWAFVCLVDTNAGMAEALYLRSR